MKTLKIITLCVLICFVASTVLIAADKTQEQKIQDKMDALTSVYGPNAERAPSTKKRLYQSLKKELKKIKDKDKPKKTKDDRFGE